MKKDSWNLHELLFWSVLLYAAVVRIKDLSTGLPLHTLYGENDTLQILLRMLQTGNLNPGHFDLPGLAYYLYVPFLYSFYLFGNLFGYFPDIGSIPGTSFIFIGRFVCALFGTASVYWTYRIGKFYSDRVSLLAMAILAASPQHVEFCHMLRPEIPAIFFTLVAVEAALSVLRLPNRKHYLVFGIGSGLSFSIKYTIGLPLLAVLLLAYIAKRKETSFVWPLQSLFFYLLVFAVSNPFLISNPDAIAYWSNRIQSLYLPGEDYYGKNIFYYYFEFLVRYNYNLPLMIFAGLGLVLSVAKDFTKGSLLAACPVLVFLWLCSFETRRIHGLLSIHPFLALWGAMTLDQIWEHTMEFSRARLFKLAYTLLLGTLFFWPYYRTGVQAYLFSKTDNRSKAELWMTNRLSRGSRVAVLHFQQLELDPHYFNVEDFAPKDYVLQNKDFRWFRDHQFDYIAVSSGQYMRYFTEGETARKYRDYFLNLFRDGSTEGTLVLDLVTHPLLIPDYRIKLFSTRRQQGAPRFLNATDSVASFDPVRLSQSGTVLSLPPGYYSLALSSKNLSSFEVTVKNLELHEVILHRQEDHALSASELRLNLPFAIFPIRRSSRFSLFSRTQPELIANQPIQFYWRTISVGLEVKQTEPKIEVTKVEFSPAHTDEERNPFLLFNKEESFYLSCSLHNRSQEKVTGYLEGFLSGIGEAQPGKNFESASGMQEFFLESGQSITIEVSMNTETLTGDHQLSYWIFTRSDLPYSPQYGGWFNKQIRVNDPKLGIHPVYGIPIP